jgi:hypothetical protein
MSTIHTSPLLFLRPGGHSSIAGKPLGCNLSLQEIELLSFFSNPASPGQATEAGFDPDLIDRSLEQGFLVPCDESGFGAGSTWEAYNLQRAAFLMFSCFQDASAPNSSFKATLTAAKNGIGQWFSVLLNRRTERFFTADAVPLATLTEIASAVNEAIGDNNWLSFRILVQSVDGLSPGVYAFDANSGKFVTCVEKYNRKDLLEDLHGQWWLNGGGVCWFFHVSLSALSDNSRTKPKNYFELILLLGAAGQALVNAVYRAGLGCWMTPALSESLAAKILGLDAHKEEALYFFKIGIPERAAIATDERRSPI